MNHSEAIKSEVIDYLSNMLRLAEVLSPELVADFFEAEQVTTPKGKGVTQTTTVRCTMDWDDSFMDKLPNESFQNQPHG